MSDKKIKNVKVSKKTSIIKKQKNNKSKTKSQISSVVKDAGTGNTYTFKKTQKTNKSKSKATVQNKDGKVVYSQKNGKSGSKLRNKMSSWWRKLKKNKNG